MLDRDDPSQHAGRLIIRQLESQFGAMLKLLVGLENTLDVVQVRRPPEHVKVIAVHHDQGPEDRVSKNTRASLTWDEPGLLEFLRVVIFPNIAPPSSSRKSCALTFRTCRRP